MRRILGGEARLLISHVLNLLERRHHGIAPTELGSHPICIVLGGSTHRQLEHVGCKSGGHPTCHHRNPQGYHTAAVVVLVRVRGGLALCKHPPNLVDAA